ncbi:hypothetical protein MASR2M78_10420 [Treponema sp.]
MADPELVRTIDYILNRCDEAAIEAVAASVVRRKKELSLFGSSGLRDPRSFAQGIAKKTSLGSGLGAVRETVRNMAVEMLRREAPELDEDQIDELLSAWIPDGQNAMGSGGQAESLPPDVLSSMVDQFVAYSTGEMRETDDTALRKELGSWPERYWKAFPGLIRAIITDHLNGNTTGKQFKTKLRAALQLGNSEN